MHPIRNILLRLRIYFKIFSSKMLVVIKLPQSLARLFVGLDRSFKKFIIDSLAYFKRINNPQLLFLRRIYPKPIHSQFHDNMEVEPIFKHFGGLRLIHPTLKRVGILSQFL